VSNLGLLVRKAAIAFAVGAGIFFLAAAPSLVDAFQKEDWTDLGALGRAALFGAVAAGARALISYLTAFVPSDAEHGVNLIGKYKRS
jgi:hypothetical protein